ncbi:MAG: hypothetical protein JJU05_01850 [Verrucomicrobia bacterium]|nr:hypothetical protein [Verrucomicrobiota bacterium]MCH8526152.1 DUF6364 family protein [Kiritimatiellia bacterium]
MNTKLTLVMESDIIRSAKVYAERHGTSVSQLVEQYIGMVSAGDAAPTPRLSKRGSLTSALAGSIQALNGEEKNFTAKELVARAKAERFGS